MESNREKWKHINSHLVMLNKWTQRAMYTAQTSQIPILEKTEDLENLGRRIMRAVVDVGKDVDHLPRQIAPLGLRGLVNDPDEELRNEHSDPGDLERPIVKEGLEDAIEDPLEDLGPSELADAQPLQTPDQRHALIGRVSQEPALRSIQRHQ